MHLISKQNYSTNQPETFFLRLDMTKVIETSREKAIIQRTLRTVVRT